MYKRQALDEAIARRRKEIEALNRSALEDIHRIGRELETPEVRGLAGGFAQEALSLIHISSQRPEKKKLPAASARPPQNHSGPAKRWVRRQHVSLALSLIHI